MNMYRPASGICSDGRACDFLSAIGLGLMILQLVHRSSTLRVAGGVCLLNRFRSALHLFSFSSVNYSGNLSKSSLKVKLLYMHNHLRFVQVQITHQIVMDTKIFVHPSSCRCLIANKYQMFFNHAYFASLVDNAYIHP